MDILGWDIPLTWTLLVGCILLVYLYGKWRNRLLKDAGIPGPEPDIYLGNLRVFLKGLDFDNKRGKQYGKVYGMYLGGLPMIIVSDPDILRQVLVKDFQNFTDRMVLDLDDHPVNTGIFFNKGVDWRRLRNIISPAFSGGKLRMMCDRINQCSSVLTDNFVAAAKKNESVLLKDYFGRFTMDVIASTAFGIDTDSQNDVNNEFVEKARQVFADDFLKNPWFLIAMIFPATVPLLKLLGVSSFPKDSIQFFVKAVVQMIEQRKEQSKEGDKKPLDFLQLLLNAEGTELTEDGVGEQGAHAATSSTQTGKKMTTNEVLGQAFLFFIAGYETTGNTLHFAAYSLATNPHVQDKLIEEIDTVLADTEPSYDNINELVYLDHVMTETLRMYPAVPVFNRMVKDTVTIKGYTFPRGATISVPSVIMHRDPEVFPDPHTFNPDRWEKKADIDPMAYLPFGHGPRTCLGMRLAQVEMKLAMAHVLKKVKFVRLPDTPESLRDFSAGGVLSPKKPLKLRVELR